MKKLFIVLFCLIIFLLPIKSLANEELTQINSVTIMDLYKPAPNKEVSIEKIKISNENVELVSADWFIKENDTYVLYDEESFKKNETYAINITLKTNSGYEFADEISIIYNDSYIEKVEKKDNSKTSWYKDDNGNINVFILSTNMPNSYDNVLIGLLVLAVGIFTVIGNKLGNKVFNKGKIKKK